MNNTLYWKRSTTWILVAAFLFYLGLLLGNFIGSWGLLSFVLSVFVKLFACCVAILYVWSLSRFKHLLTEEDARSIQKILVSVWFLLFWIFFSVIPFFGFWGLICLLVATIQSIVGFSRLKKSKVLPRKAKAGASKLLVAVVLILASRIIAMLPAVGEMLALAFGFVSLVFIVVGWWQIRQSGPIEKIKTFPKGGVHPSENKLSCAKPIEVLPLPDVVTIPLSQHIGAPAVAKVAKGDKVLTGQLIAEAGSFMSANIHSPISGTVTAVEPVANGQGVRQMSIVIKREGDEWAEGIDRTPELVRECTLEPQQIIALIKEAGIVGMGGATFPTHVKLSVPPGKKAEALIINGVECEPYLTSDHRTMLERGEQLLVGVTILKRALGVERAYVGVENNKPDAIEHLRRLAAGYEGIEIVPLRVKYPQGGEKQLIAAITGREVPPPPALPIDVGAVVCNASTTVAVYEAVQKHKPLIERVVTITGKGMKEPKNLLTRMGTPISTLIEAAGGLPADAGKVINGGPMMGRAMVNLEAPVTKGCSGITVMSGRDAVRRTASQCIKCAKCVSACPMGLEPYFLSKMTQKKNWDEVEARMVTSCIECGCCQSTCPAYLPLLDWIRLGKQTVMGIIRARAAANAPKK